ncbi:MAG: site-specific integrase, partial [Coxiellaceae bacterium]|nr:site-specific integrase [Coxiellaceae bacterium]
MKIDNLSPLPLFDSIEYIHLQHDFSYLQSGYQSKDIKIAIEFLKSYRGSLGTFNAYRREIERLLHWCALISKTTLKKLKRNDIEDFIRFAQKPPREWIGKTKPPRFIVKDGKRTPNTQWRPFIVTVSKAQYRQGETPKIKDFELTQGS